MNILVSIALLITLHFSVLAKQADTTFKAGEIQKVDNSKYYTTKDTVFIPAGDEDTIKYSKTEFNKIIDNHPEFFDEYPRDPDQSYYCNNDEEEFSSEIGQDTYYILFSYFLQQRNGVDQYAEQRKKLISLYENINSLFQSIQHGGTYFVHQSARIMGYAEYSVYIYIQIRDEIKNSYNITKQKDLYIKLLRQIIADNSTIDFETNIKEKKEQIKNQNKIVDELSKLITDIFYLRCAQEFQYKNN